MELVRNKASGKFFVVIDDTGGSDFLVITPEGKIKRLERYLFEPHGITDPREAFFRHQISKKQVDLYAEHAAE